METIPPYPMGPGQRALAAIVFTDVVSFSARMQADEERTLKLLDRDFEVMRRYCIKYSGSVLKTTGDGLLLYFTSAVLAVACALRMQQHFAKNSKTLPANETLTHRIGIHLGDVFVNDQDVMGDGVNIAARLQAEAEPGGICISQTVYDVVKNKLDLQVTQLGPRELKNIAQAIPVYRLVLDAQAKAPAPVEPRLEKPASTAPIRPRGRGQLLAVAAGLALLLLLTAAWMVQIELRVKEERANGVAARAAMNSLLAEDGSELNKENHDRLVRAVVAWRQELKENRSRAAEEYDFTELGRSLRDPKTEVAHPADVHIREEVLHRIQALFGWMGTAMQRYTQARPLVVRELSGTAPKEIRVFAGPDRRLYYVEGGAVRQRNWTDQKPSVLGAIIAGALLDTQPLPPREAVQGAQSFAYFYGLPELIEALRQGRGRRATK